MIRTIYKLPIDNGEIQFADHAELVSYCNENVYSINTAVAVDIEFPDLEIVNGEIVKKKILSTISKRQIRQALFLTGVSVTTVETALNTLSDPEKTLALIAWDNSLTYDRYTPLVSGVAVLLGWTEQNLDDLWILAGGL